MNEKEIIFCVGLQKSGTSSLNKALRVLGYTVKSYIPELIAPMDKWRIGSESAEEGWTFDPEKHVDLSILNDYDGFSDNPCSFAPVYKTVDKEFPNAKFILTIRSREKWANSAKKHCDQAMYHSVHEYRINNFKNYDPDKDIIYSNDNMGLIEYLYQTPYKHMDLEAFAKHYDEHHAGVFEYFKDRDDFLVLDLEKGDGWEELCAFLGKEVPKRHFPHSHTYRPSYIKLGEKYGKVLLPRPAKEVLKKIFWKYIE